MSDTFPDACVMCGHGELSKETVADDRVDKLKENDPELADTDLHALVCQGCGHVAYRRR